MKNNDARVLGAELVGTAVLLIGGPGSAILAGDRIGVLGVSLAFGFSLLVMAYVVGPISGCHINPAVTLAMLLARKIPMGHAIMAWIGQIVGAALGGAIILGIANGVEGFERGSFAANGWANLSPGGYNLGSAIVIEVVLTALLVVVVLTTTNEELKVNFGGLTLGITLALIHMISIPVTNTSVNPARSFGTAIYATLDSDALEQLWAFILFPLVGAILGVFVWLMLSETRLEETELFMPGLAAARDMADKVVDEVVDEVEEHTDSPDAPGMH
ncbi:MAG: aquaporin [Actinomycetota bacterium]|nr:MAG: aquaporin [Actinomycetota bacterium]